MSETTAELPPLAGLVCTLCGSKELMHKCPDPRPFTIHRNRRGWPRWYQRWLEAWWIVRGKWSMHQVWQEGVFHGTASEYRRTVINGGR